MQPLISIIIPIYNVEAYLHRCIDSVLLQTYSNLEIWLVDDGSPDRCGIICDEYAEKDNRIRVIHKPNGGLSDARNAALDKMQGEWVIFVDSDDYIATTHVEELIKLALNNHSEIAVHSLCRFSELHKPQPRTRTISKLYDTQQALQSLFYQKDFDNAACGKIYHTSLFKDIRYPKGLLYEDLATTYRLIQKAQYVAFSSSESYFYFTRHDSIENSSFSETKLESCLVIIKQLETFMLESPQIVPAIRCRILSFAFHILLEMPTQHPMTWKLEEIIYKYRIAVLLDYKARTKARIAALLSFLGTNFIRVVFHKSLAR